MASLAPPSDVAPAPEDFGYHEGLRDQLNRALSDDLPLFASVPQRAESPAGRSPLAAALDGIGPDDLSPREALEELYKLKRIATGDDGD